MKGIARKFLRLLAIEIESLHDELEVVINSLEDRLARYEITEYVRNENFATLRNELLGVEDCLNGCGEFSVADDAGIEEVAYAMKRFVRARLHEHGYVEAVHTLIEKRIDKVVAYLKIEIGA